MRAEDAAWCEQAGKAETRSPGIEFGLEDVDRLGRIGELEKQRLHEDKADVQRQCEMQMTANEVHCSAPICSSPASSCLPCRCSLHGPHPIFSGCLWSSSDTACHRSPCRPRDRCRTDRSEGRRGGKEGGSQ